MARPRLWVVTECYPNPRGVSNCAFAHRQLVGLTRAGWDVRVLLPNGWFPRIAWRLAPAWRQARHASIPAGWTVDGISVQDLRYQNRVPSRLSRPLSASARVRDALENKLRAAHVRADTDMVMAMFALPYGHAAHDAARSVGLPYVVQLRGDDVWVWPHSSEQNRQGFNLAVTQADLVLSVSRSLLTEAQRLCADRLPPAVVVPNGIDSTTFRPTTNAGERRAARAALGILPNELAILCVGDAIARKGWKELFAAVAAAARKQSGQKVVVIATLASLPPEIDVVREAALLPENARLIVKRGLPRLEMAELYRAVDLFCLPSHWEGLANAVLEALASGLPVITTNVAGHPEVITDGVDGLLVPPKDPVRLEQAVLELYSADLRDRLGRVARERALAVGDSTKAGARLALALEAVRRGSVEPALASSNPYAPSRREKSDSRQAGVAT